MENLSDSGFDLLYKLLCYDPCQRISAIQALKHPYFDEINKQNKQTNEFL